MDEFFSNLSKGFTEIRLKIKHVNSLSFSNDTSHFVAFTRVVSTKVVLKRFSVEKHTIGQIRLLTKYVLIDYISLAKSYRTFAKIILDCNQYDRIGQFFESSWWEISFQK